MTRGSTPGAREADWLSPPPLNLTISAARQWKTSARVFLPGIRSRKRLELLCTLCAKMESISDIQCPSSEGRSHYTAATPSLTQWYMARSRAIPAALAQSPALILQCLKATRPMAAASRSCLRLSGSDQDSPAAWTRESRRRPRSSDSLTEKMTTSFAGISSAQACRLRGRRISVNSDDYPSVAGNRQRRVIFGSDYDVDCISMSCIGGDGKSHLVPFPGTSERNLPGIAVGIGILPETDRHLVSVRIMGLCSKSDHAASLCLDVLPFLDFDRRLVVGFRK